MYSFVKGRYTMLAEVYKQEVTQDEDTGEMLRRWRYDAPIEIRCIVRGIQGGGIRVVGSTERWENGEYDDVEWAMMQTSHNMSKRDRVGNIRTVDSWGRVRLAWSDLHIEDGEEEETDIRFEVLGSKPILDPFGNLIEYDVLMTRATMQGRVSDEPTEWEEVPDEEREWFD